MGQLVGTKIWQSHPGYLHFECPGCKRPHAFWTKEYYGGDETKHPVWEWNGSGDKPSVKPSINCAASTPSRQCHFFLTDGKICYQPDCHHALKGQSVEIPDWAEDWE